MPAIITNDVTSLTPIQKFYSGSSIFITGGTGFLGKVLLEKLLRTCPDLNVIYLLIRDKRGMTAQQRVDKLFEDPLFDKLKIKNPNYKRKITVVKGDCSLAGMGLNSKTTQMLINNVNIVFHGAATVRFDEHFRSAMNINVKGTHTILDLAKKMLQLKSFVYVSTAYSNCYMDHIEEKFYEFPYNYEELSQLVDKLDDNTIDELTPKILGKWPNTYAMTKAMAENLICLRNSSMPTGIFRPAIVISTYEEPIPGWTDNYYNLTGISAAGYVGIARTMYARDECTANVVPVDMSVNALISCAKEVADKWEKTSTPPIYNFVSNTDNPITWGEMGHILKMYGTTYPVLRGIWPISFTTVRSVFLHDLLMFLMLFPAAIMDILRLIFYFRKPILFKMIFKMRSSLKLFQHFCTHDYSFTNNNMKNLCESLSEKDRILFNCDINSVNWMKYLKDYVLGVRRYLIKEDDSTIPAAKRHYIKLRVIWDGISILLGYTILNWTLKMIFYLFGTVYSAMGF